MNDTGIVSLDSVETALESIGWDNWLRDKQGWFRLRVGADEEHGNLETEYFFGIRDDWDNALVFRLYAIPWFSGLPAGVMRACHEWNAACPYPKAALIEDKDGDSKLVLEMVLPCWDEAIPQSFVNRLIDEFRSGCAVFLTEYAEALCEAPRYVGAPASSVH